MLLHGLLFMCQAFLQLPFSFLILFSFALLLTHLHLFCKQQVLLTFLSQLCMQQTSRSPRQHLTLSQLCGCAGLRRVYLAVPIAGIFVLFCFGTRRSITK